MISPKTKKPVGDYRWCIRIQMKTPFRNCPVCNAEIARTAQNCPKCGHSFWAIRLAVAGFILIATALLGIGADYVSHSYTLQAELGEEVGRPARNIALLTVGTGVVFAVISGITWWRYRKLL